MKVPQNYDGVIIVQHICNQNYIYINNIIYINYKNSLF